MNRRSSYTPWPWIVLSSLTLLIVGGIGMGFLGLLLGGDKADTRERVGVINLSGEISDEGTRGVLGGRTGGARGFIEAVESAEKDPSIKAVVIRINSPGGSASASQEMFQAVRRLEKAKPVICSMGDVAASGGYYVASACDKIYANGSTLTGSIGVISQFLNYQGLFKKVGLDEATIKSGKFKDAGNPARPITAEERQLFQRLILNVYGQFVSDVVTGRAKATSGKLTRAKLLKLADGRVYTGLQAKNNLLVDAIGGLHEAVADAAKAGGITGEPTTREIDGDGGLGSLFGASAERGVSGLARSAGDQFVAGASARARQELQSDAQTQPLQAR